MPKGNEHVSRDDSNQLKSRDRVEAQHLRVNKVEDTLRSVITLHTKTPKGMLIKDLQETLGRDNDVQVKLAKTLKALKQSLEEIVGQWGEHHHAEAQLNEPKKK